MKNGGGDLLRHTVQHRFGFVQLAVFQAQLDQRVQCELILAVQRQGLPKIRFGPVSVAASQSRDVAVTERGGDVRSTRNQLFGGFVVGRVVAVLLRPIRQKRPFIERGRVGIDRRLQPFPRRRFRFPLPLQSGRQDIDRGSEPGVDAGAVGHLQRGRQVAALDQQLDPGGPDVTAVRRGLFRAFQRRVRFGVPPEGGVHLPGPPVRLIVLWAFLDVRFGHRDGPVDGSLSTMVFDQRVPGGVPGGGQRRRPVDQVRRRGGIMVRRRGIVEVFGQGQ